MNFDDFYEELGIIVIEGTEKRTDFSRQEWEKWETIVRPFFSESYFTSCLSSMKEDSTVYLIPFTCKEYKLFVNPNGKTEEEKLAAALLPGDFEKYLSENFG